MLRVSDVEGDNAGIVTGNRGIGYEICKELKIRVGLVVSHVEMR
jgi:hypothetical protein